VAARSEFGFLRDPALLRLWDVLPGARVVGGAVRDGVLGYPVADIDLATSLLPEDVVALVQAAGLRVIPTGLAHGTVTALVDGRSFEVTTLRRDVATDGRHATVAYTANWAADAARRDFTFNAMSLERDGTVHDHFGGRADLAAGEVRFVGDPAIRIAEDYLRVLRFFRFLARYGRGAPDAATLAALRGGVPGLAILSPERVWSELKRILIAPDPVAALSLAGTLGVIAAVLPEASHPDRLATLVSAGAPADPLLRLAAWVDGEVDPLADRLRLSNPERDTLLAYRQPAPELTEAGFRRALADAPATVVAGRLWLAGAETSDVARLNRIAPPTFPLHGRDLLSLGATPGPALGLALQSLREEWLAGGCVADANALKARFRGQLAGEAPG